MIFKTQLAYSFDPQTGHRLVLHLTSAKRPEMHFELLSGDGAFNHFYCELLKGGMSETEWSEAVTAVSVLGRLPQPLPRLDLDDDDIKRLKLHESRASFKSVAINSTGDGLNLA